MLILYSSLILITRVAQLQMIYYIKGVFDFRCTTRTRHLRSAYWLRYKTGTCNFIEQTLSKVAKSQKILSILSYLSKEIEISIASTFICLHTSWGTINLYMLMKNGSLLKMHSEIWQPLIMSFRFGNFNCLINFWRVKEDYNFERSIGLTLIDIVFSHLVCA